MADFFAASLGPRQPANVLDWSQLTAQEAPQAADWTVPEAFLAVLFAAATCDGALASVEHEELLALVHRSRALKTLTPGQLAELNIRIAARLRQDDAALPGACAALPEDMRLSVFAHALDLVMADGELTVDEADFLNALILNLKLDREGVARVADVITLKNRY
jgi:uncharacterized tellurite resistance protein B-like protein